MIEQIVALCSLPFNTSFENFLSWPIGIPALLVENRYDNHSSEILYYNITWKVLQITQINKYWKLYDKIALSSIQPITLLLAWTTSFFNPCFSSKLTTEYYSAKDYHHEEYISKQWLYSLGDYSLTVFGKRSIYGNSDAILYLLFRYQKLLLWRSINFLFGSFYIACEKLCYFCGF